ncbi:sn-glycerol-3-phosphate ABC transporter ATP-binding protein UgpC [bacterium]|nr:sn-glycerol-3-phosphate ABC transporter ATP-binding protein UgpC [candidate division CSSED10-310 bacterium]
MASVTFEHVYKRFDDTAVVNDFNFTIDDREFVVIVGPSGCGKSTTLRMVAGLESISSGIIRIGDRVINDVSPKDRDIAMVFQNYALYPHMNVYRNMAFGLQLRKLPGPEIDHRVRKASQILGIEELMERKPKQLSGGQRQRVAVGRAIVREPAVFLFDEPLSNLDAKLRVQMRAEIKKLHDQLKTTMMYVTHDQVEAMTMGDRIVILKGGYLQQAGSPMTVYRYPENVFVAGFIGSPSMNFIQRPIVGGAIDLDGHSVAFDGIVSDLFDLDGRASCIFGIRPEDLVIRNDSMADNAFGRMTGRVELVETTGSESLVHIVACGEGLVARLSSEVSIQAGESVTLSFPLKKIHLFDPISEKSLRKRVENEL